MSPNYPRGGTPGPGPPLLSVPLTNILTSRFHRDPRTLVNPRGAFLCGGQIWFVKRLEIKATVTFVGRACGGAERMPRRNNNDKGSRVSPIIEGGGAGQVFGPSHNSQAIATALPAGQVVSLLGVLFINFSPTLPSCLSASRIPTTLTEYQQQEQKVSQYKLVFFKLI